MFYKQPALHGKLDSFGKLTKKGKQVVLFQNFDGFAVPVVVLKLVKSVEIHYQGDIYSATKKDFEEHGIYHMFKEEPQMVLPRPYWHKTEQGTLV